MMREELPIKIELIEDLRFITPAKLERRPRIAIVESEGESRLHFSGLRAFGEQ